MSILTKLEQELGRLIIEDLNLEDIDQEAVLFKNPGVK